MPEQDVRNVVTSTPSVMAITTVEVPNTDGEVALRLTRRGAHVEVEAVRAPRGREKKPVNVSALREAVALLGE